jgi:hypothetical protein
MEISNFAVKFMGIRQKASCKQLQQPHKDDNCQHTKQSNWQSFQQVIMICADTQANSLTVFLIFVMEWRLTRISVIVHLTT